MNGETRVRSMRDMMAEIASAVLDVQKRVEALEAAPKAAKGGPLKGRPMPRTPKPSQAFADAVELVSEEWIASKKKGKMVDFLRDCAAMDASVPQFLKHYPGTYKQVHQLIVERLVGIAAVWQAGT